MYPDIPREDGTRALAISAGGTRKCSYAERPLVTGGSVQELLNGLADDPGDRYIVLAREFL